MLPLPCTLLGFAMILPATCHSQDLTVPLPPGVTPLCDIGVYRVAYQSYGGDVVQMPESWTGHFVDPSGISYLPGEFVMGRSAILLHSPWRVPAGKVWVDYHLRLPEVRPITLSFATAMRDDVTQPVRSDGVTFSCYLLDESGERELMRQHQDTSQWHEYSFDLSEFAGREVTVRLQTEPGPNNDPGWDYSYFGDARIIAGSETGSRKALLEQLTNSRAYRATEGVSLVALANRPDRGVTPSNLLEYSNSVRPEEDGWAFRYEAADCDLVYTYVPRTGTLDDVTVRVDDGPVFRPAAGGCVQALTRTGSAPLSGGRLLKAELDEAGRAVQVVWEYPSDGGPIRVTWKLGIVGKALTVQADCEAPVLTGLSLGSVAGAPLRRMLYVPYLPADWARGTVSFLPLQGLFVCRYLDWTESHSSRCPQGEAVYEPKTDGTRNPLHESGYVAVSPNVNEVLPNIPNPPSPYLDRLAPLVMLDIWGQHKGTFQGSAENLRNLKDNGVDHLAIINHVWQRYGYDVKLPDHIPANPDLGGEEGMIEFGRAANECGYLWSLHENYIDLYPDAPSYDPSAVVLRPDGSPSLAWFNGVTQSYGLKCTRALDYARQNSPYIHERYGTTAAYLDVHTCVPPWHQLDHDATQPMAAMALSKVIHDTQLFQFMRDTHGGPLFGEGANHFYWAGKCDGVEAQIAGGEHHVPFLDFDLLKIHPQMVNHGMGYYERWFERGYGHQWGVDTGTAQQVDKYRAQEVAYGHAGFIGAAQVDNVQWVAKEHHLVHPVQRLYGAAKVTEVSYEVDGRMVSGSVALALDERWRQRIRYDSGLTVWVNWGKEPWEVEGRLLPQWGFLALGPDTEVWTALRNGVLADYVECPEYVFADARTYFHMPYLAARVDIEPRLREFRYLGGDRILLTYEWVINDTLDQDYFSFVHFSNAADRRNSGIVFQQDHPLPRPTSQWQLGQVLVDGPYEITVSPEYDTYDILIGLYRAGGRVSLKGLNIGDDRIIIGRLRLTRLNGTITDIRLEDPEDIRRQHAQRQADFTAHLNPAGTWVDFGPVATNGSVKVNRGERQLTVFPYPRDREFTVTLDVAALAYGAAPAPGTVRVRALAAGTREDMGEVPCTVEDGRISFRVGLKGAGRYVVSW